MSARQFASWLDYMAEEPFGGAMDDRRSGEVVAVVLNALRDPRKRSKPYVWTDVYPHHRRHAPPRDELANARAMFSQMMAIGRSLGFAPPPKKGR